MWLKFVYGSVRPLVVDWVKGRALRIPESKLQELALRFKVSTDVVRAMESEIASAFINELDTRIYGKVMPF